MKKFNFNYSKFSIFLNILLIISVILLSYKLKLTDGKFKDLQKKYDEIGNKLASFDGPVPISYKPNLQIGNKSSDINIKFPGSEDIKYSQSENFYKARPYTSFEFEIPNKKTYVEVQKFTNDLDILFRAEYENSTSFLAQDLVSQLSQNEGTYESQDVFDSNREYQIYKNKNGIRMKRSIVGSPMALDYRVQFITRANDYTSRYYNFRFEMDLLANPKNNKSAASDIENHQRGIKVAAFEQADEFLDSIELDN